MIAYLTQSSNFQNVNLPPECPWVSWFYNTGDILPTGAIVVTDTEFSTLYESYRSLIEQEEELIKTALSAYKIESDLIPITYSFTNGTQASVVVRNPRIHNVKNEATSSTLTLYITSTGTAQGIPLFYNLEECGIVLTTRTANTANNQAPWAVIESIVGNVINIRIKRSNTGSILIGGSYSGNVNNDLNVTVYLQITGLSA